MSVPREFIWEGVKSDALEIITDGVKGDLAKALTLFEWRDYGGYHVTGSTSLDFLASCSTKEYGEMIAREVAALLDQALEHRLVLADACKSDSTPSTSWLLVTTYYWCVFLALAWLRLVGKVVTYLPTDEIERLTELFAKPGHKRPRNGTFVITVTDLTGARSNIRYRRLKANNFHEGLWDTFYGDIQQRLASAARERAGVETRLFSALNFRSRIDKTGWPSKLRNIINYRVGYGYGSVNGGKVPDLLPVLKLAKSADIENLIRQLEDIQVETAGRTVEEHPNEYAKIMLLFGSLMTHVLEEYCADVWEERGIDPAWKNRRNQYTGLFGHALASLWPM